MSYFRNLFGKKQVVELHDPVFGHLTYEKGIWNFAPEMPGNNFMITVDAPDSGPTQVQRDFFQRIRSSLAEFEQRAHDFMRSRVEQGVDVSRLSVYSIEIGGDDESRCGSFVLEMTDDDAFVVHRVSFKADEPVDYGFDD